MTTTENDIALLDRALNEAFAGADISRSYEEYWEILERFYADEVEVASNSIPGSLSGKDKVQSVLSSLLVPLHVLAEDGGLSVGLSYSSVRSDAHNERHTDWTLHFSGILGRASTTTWSSVRRWERGKVIYESHFNHQHNGEVLSAADLDFGGILRQRLEDARPASVGQLRGRTRASP